MTLLAVPRVHLNGTSQKELLTQLTEAIAALHNADAKLAAAAPHMRDYYPQPSDVWPVAQDEHRCRRVWLKHIIDELSTIALAVSEQGHGRDMKESA